MKDLNATTEVALILSELNAGWRNVVAKAMGLDGNRFQMVQGCPAIGGGAGLMQIADMVPVQSGTGFYDEAAVTRPAAFGQLLDALRKGPDATDPGLSDRAGVATALCRAAEQAIENGAAAQINYNSQTAPIASTGTVVAGSSAGSGVIFSGPCGMDLAGYDLLAAGSDMTITGRIGAYATLATPPVPEAEAAQISRAYNGKNEPGIWDHPQGAAVWGGYFGADGLLARRVSHLLLVSDYALKVTSKAGYAGADVAQIEAAATGGVWPFFGPGAAQRSLQHNTDGSLSLQYVLPKGQIEIWGVLLSAAPN